MHDVANLQDNEDGGLVSKVWHNQSESLLCAATAAAAFNVGEVTIHQLLQLPIEHEDRTAGYWKLGKDAIKVMRRSMSNLRFLIIDKVFVLSNLNLHLRLEDMTSGLVVSTCSLWGHLTAPTCQWSTSV